MNTGTDRVYASVCRIMKGIFDERIFKVQSGSVSMHHLLPDVHLLCTPVVVNIFTLQTSDGSTSVSCLRTGKKAP